MKRFNVTGICVPGKNYMVDISGKIAQIRKLIDSGSYFTINRARQYGKTTTLYELRRALKDDYTVIKISFEGLGDESFSSPETFCQAFIGQIITALQSPSVNVEIEYIEKWENYSVINFDLLSRHITNMCRDRKIVLMIDEVDKTSNNRVFLHFLSMLRTKFLASQTGDDYTFHSVILAGVYDIKNIKLKLINEGLYTPSQGENKIYNSPWNIAVNFIVDMSFNPAEIATMLNEYEADHITGMDIKEIAEEIYNYTNGYPFLVSRICQCIDEGLDANWTLQGVHTAVNIILEERNTLFDDLIKNLENDKELYSLIFDLLIIGEKKTYSAGNPTISLGEMFGIIERKNGKLRVSNKIFETVIADYFVSKTENDPSNKPAMSRYGIIKNGRFDMELCMRKFAEHYAELYNERDITFLEREGKFLFITYIRPLLNGDGFYHFESEFADLRRMDLVVDFGREQFIIELKIWRGEQYEESAYKQLTGYMETKKADKGYLLTFDFRKGANKQPKAEWIEFDGKMIFDMII